MKSIQKQLAGILFGNWWVLLLRGLAAIAFGILTWLQPGISLATLVLFFGAYTLVDGILGIWTAVTGREKHDDWWVLLLWGLMSVGVGIMTFLAPGITAIVLLFYIAAWAIATGLLQIIAAIQLRKEITGEWRLVLAGLASVIFGALLMAQPGVGALALAWMIAAYALILGLLLVFLALRMRSFIS